MRFRNDGQFPPNHKALQIPLALYGIVNFSFREATSGIENATFLITTPVNRFALRIYRQHKKLDGEITQELAFMEVLGEQGIPVPAVHANRQGQLVARFVCEGVAWDAILMSYIAGEHPEGGYTTMLITQMADVQARMHYAGIEFAQHQTRHTRALTKLKETSFLPRIDLQAVTDGRQRGLLHRIEQFELHLDSALPRGYSHFDYDAGNLLVDSRGTLVGVLDFDDLTYGPVVTCLAYTLWDILDSPNGEAMAHEYLSQYEQNRPLSTLERGYLAPCMLFRHYMIAALRVLEGDMEDEALERTLLLEKYLQRQKIW